MRNNLILLTVDALRFDEFKKRFIILEKGTNRKFIFFDNAFANGCGTSRSFPSILCSSYPLAFGKSFNISKYETTLAEVLKKNNYSTLGFVASNPFVSSILGYSRGFDYFNDYLEFKGNTTPGKISWALSTTRNLILGRPNYPRANKVLSDALKKLAELENDKSFFVWTHLMDAHLPWLPPSKNLGWKIGAVMYNIKFRHMLKEYKGKRDGKLLLNNVVNKAKQLYVRSVEYLIDSLREFSREIDKRYPNTWIVILADHGEAFGEMGIIGHPPELYDITLHVPLVIFPPLGILKENIHVKELFSLIDLSPTVLNLLELSSESRFFGKPRDFFKYVGDGFVYSEALEEDGSDKINISDGHEIISLRTNKYRYVWRESKKAEELYYIHKHEVALQNEIEIRKPIKKINEETMKLRRKIRQKAISHKLLLKKQNTRDFLQ